MDNSKVQIERWGEDRIAARIPWSLGGKDAAKSIAGARPVWDKSNLDRDVFRFWSYPLTLFVCRRFREVFGQDLEIGPNLFDWAREAVKAEQEMELLRAGKDADLPLVRQNYPVLWEALQNRPFQIAGAAFIRQGKHVCLGDEPRLGKTYQALAAAVETGSYSILVACPRTAVRTVWARKIQELLGKNAYVAQGDRFDRELVIQQFHGHPIERGMKFLIINREMIRVKRYYECPDGTRNLTRPGLKGGCQKDHQHKTVEVPEYPGLFSHPFDMIIFDESHNVLASSKHQISANIPQIRLGAMRLQSTSDGVRLAMSGTWARSKNVKTWGTLNWLDPVTFSSFWRFAEEHFGVTETGYQGAREIGSKLKSEAKFQDTLRPYYLARTKLEVAPQLPPIEYAGTHPPGHTDGPVGVYLDMVNQDGEPTKQAKAYHDMEEVGLATLAGGHRLTANGVLAELTRLKQFACSYGEMSRAGEFRPVLPSCKLDWVLDFLAEREGLTGKVVIASQFTKLVKLFAAEIRKKHWEVVTIMGESTDVQRDHAQDVFLNGSPRVAIINMYAGGEAIDLSSADEMILLDEPWEGYILEQVENRIQNLAKKNQLTIYRLRAAGTIETDIALMTDEQRAELLAGRPKAMEKFIEIRERRQQDDPG
jgi:SNF2-related domain/Helicase conserved C-terminal domain